MKRLLLVAALTGIMSSAAFADCPPEKFLLDEKTDLLQQDEIRLAFVESMNQEQFEQAQKKFGAGASFPIDGVPINVFLNLSDAKSGREKRS
jgi:hypothetical protein